MKYSPGDILQGWNGRCTVVGYIRYSKSWYYVLMNSAEECIDVYQGEVEIDKYWRKVGEAA